MHSLNFLKRNLRLFWRDLLMITAETSSSLDDKFSARFFRDCASQYKWSSLDVHRTMLSDEARVKAFRDAISEVVGENDTVLDFGTGMGILAFFASSKAKKVYAVDSAGIVDLAKEIGEKNNFKNIVYMRSDVNDLDLPKKVDCVISEIIGMHIIDEGLTGKIRKVRQFLKEGGRIIPKKIDVYLCPAESRDIGLGFWGNLYGIDFSTVKKETHEIRTCTITDKTKKLSDEGLMYSIDLENPPVKQIKAEKDFMIKTDGVFHGCYCFFKAHLSDNIVLSTSPDSPLTHWKQFFLPNNERTAVKAGDVVRVTLWGLHDNTAWKWKYEIIKH